MARLPGRIRRISLDAGMPTNYTVEATSSYDAAAPAATAASWGTDDEVTDLDQSVTLASPTEIEHQGALITFVRGLFLFTGVVVKIRPTYNFENNENPFLELWTHDSVALEWTPRRKVQLASGFVGVPSGQARFFEFFLAVSRADCDKVWVTLNPGVVGTPVMNFVSLHLFGQCRLVPKTEASCEADPTVDCIDYKEPPLETFEDPTFLDCNDFDPDVCTIPPFAWPTTPFSADGPIPKYLPPEFPTINLCDPEALQAFKAQLTDDQLEYFTTLLENMELPCLDPDNGEPPEVAPINEDPDNPGNPLLTKQPVEVYVNPVTRARETDPRSDAAADPVADPVVPVGPFTRKAWVIASDTGFPGYSGMGGCDVESAAASVATQIAACNMASTSILCDASSHAVLDTPFALTATTVLCFNSETSTDWNVTAASVLFTRLRATFDSGIADALVTIAVESGAVIYFDAAAYAASFAASKILLSDGGLGPPDTFSPGTAQWQGISALGPIDFTVIASVLAANGANFGSLSQNPLALLTARITIETLDEPVANLVMVVQ